jgi:DNA adenine methylase
MSKIVQPLKWHGGKHYLAERIVDLFPPHLHYVEPYFGGGAVLLARDPLDERFFWGDKAHLQGVSEVVNDVNRRLTNFWQVLQDDSAFAAFMRRLEATPFSQEEWRKAKEPRAPKAAPDVEAAAEFFINCRMSLAGRMKGFTGITKTRTRRTMNNEVSAWLSAIEGLPAVHQRLKRVLILNQDARYVIRKQDTEGTLFYLDPPYVHETRVTTGEYEHEMTLDQHAELLDLLAGIKGKFLLSGYRSPLYDAAAEKHGWHRADFEIDNKASTAREKPMKIECVWMNFASPSGRDDKRELLDAVS